MTERATSPYPSGSFGGLMRAYAQSFSHRKSLWACVFTFLALILVAPDRLGAALALLYVAVVAALLRIDSGTTFLRALPASIGLRWLAALATLLAPAFIPFGRAGRTGAEALAAAVLALFYGGVLLRGGERLAQLAARFGLDALPGEQQRIEAERRAGTLGTQGARSAQDEVRAGLGVLGTTDGLVALLRIEFAAFVVVLLAAFAASVAFSGIGLAPALSQHGRFALVLLLPTCFLAVRLLDEGVRLSLGTRVPVSYGALCAVLVVLGVTASLASPVASLPLLALLTAEGFEWRQRMRRQVQALNPKAGVTTAEPTDMLLGPKAPHRFALPVTVGSALRDRLEASLPNLPLDVELTLARPPDANSAVVKLPDARGTFDALAWAAARGVTLSPHLLPVTDSPPGVAAYSKLNLPERDAWPKAVLDAALRQVGAELLRFETTIAALEHYRNDKPEEVRRRLEQSAIVERLWRLQRELAAQGLLPTIPRLIDCWLHYFPGLEDGKSDELASALAFNELREQRSALKPSGAPAADVSVDAPWRVLLLDPLIESEVQNKTSLGPVLKQDIRKAFLAALKGWAQPETVVVLTGTQARKPLATLFHRAHAGTLTLDQSHLPTSLRIKRTGFIAPS